MLFCGMSLVAAAAFLAPPASAEIGVGDEAPVVEISEVFNTEPLEWKDLRGRVILLELFGTG
jgi:hypothetical protein